MSVSSVAGAPSSGDCWTQSVIFVAVRHTSVVQREPSQPTRSQRKHSSAGTLVKLAVDP